MDEIHIPKIWETSFKDVAQAQKSRDRGENLRIAVFGGNRVGKSTYTRWLCNKLLQKTIAADKRKSSVAGQSDGAKPFVLYLDLDPGQPEFTPSGVISLIKVEEAVQGTNCSHLRTPLISKFLGTLNVSDIVKLYMKSAKELIDFINSSEELSGVPLVVNTMGFCKGLGVLIACYLINLLQPSAVVQFHVEETFDNKRAFPWPLTSRSVGTYLSKNNVWWKQELNITNAALTYQFFQFDSVFVDALQSERSAIWNVKAGKLRDQMFISYFDQLLSSENFSSLISVPPKIARLSTITVATMDSSLSFDGILKAMNGNLVALVNIEVNPQQEKDAETGEVFHRHVSSLSDAAKYVNHCYGFGIVRGISAQNGLMYILTPVNESVLLKNVNCVMAAGKLGLPMELYVGPASQNLCDDDTVKFFPYLLPKKLSASRLNEAASRQNVNKRRLPKFLTKSVN